MKKFTELRENHNEDEKEILIQSPKKLSNLNNIKDPHATSIISSTPKYRKWCRPICLVFIGVKTLLGFLAIGLLLLNMNWKKDVKIPQYKPCSFLDLNTQWHSDFPNIFSTSSLRMVHVNGDDVLDVILGFGTGFNGIDVPSFFCESAFDDKSLHCEGGVMAIDGKTGQILWKTILKHKVFSLACQGDLDRDNITDCIVGGEAGLFVTLSGSDGYLLWEFNTNNNNMAVNSIYEGQFIHDLNGDGIPEILALSGEENLDFKNKNIGRIILFNGLTGKILRWMETPDSKESYYTPQILTQSDGEKFVLFGTGGHNQGGSLYVISIYDLYKRDINKAIPIYHDENRGLVVPAALVDINLDGVDDIVISTLSGNVLAFDGVNFREIWSQHFSEWSSNSCIGVSYYDEDNIPDFLIQYFLDKSSNQIDQVTVVLSGKNGSLLSKCRRETLESMTSNSCLLSLSLTGWGNDIFLDWKTGCKASSVTDETQKKNICSFENSNYSNLLLAFKKSFQCNESLIYDLTPNNNSDPNDFVSHSPFQATAQLSIKETNNRSREYFSSLNYPFSSIHNPRKRPPEFENEKVLNIPYSRTSRVKRFNSQTFSHIKIGLTGSLAPSLNYSKNSIDIILFSDSSSLLQSQLLKCLKSEFHFFKTRVQNDESLKIKDKCFVKLGQFDEKNFPKYRPSLLRLQRFNIRCVCDSKESCEEILPYEFQGWPSLNGLFGNGRFIPRNTK